MYGFCGNVFFKIEYLEVVGKSVIGLFKVSGVI